MLILLHLTGQQIFRKTTFNSLVYGTHFAPPPFLSEKGKNLFKAIASAKIAVAKLTTHTCLQVVLLLGSVAFLSPLHLAAQSGSPFRDRSPSDWLLGVSAGAQNTGVDVIHMEGNCTLTAAVMDGSNGGLYWYNSANAAGGPGYMSILFTATSFPVIFGLKDPDVALSAQRQESGWLIVATVVGVSVVDNYIYAMDYLYDCEANSFREPTQICKLGYALSQNQENPPIQDGGNSEFLSNLSHQLMTRRCYSPNVDANKDGKVVITWAEEAQVAYGAVYDAWMTNLLGISQSAVTKAVKVGSVKSAQGIAGSNDCYRGKCDGSLEIVYSHNTDPSANPPASLSTTHYGGTTYGDPVSTVGETETDASTFMWPDVTISEGTDPIVTYVFTRKTNQPVYANLSRWLITVQRKYSECGWLNSTDRSIPPVGHSFKDDWHPMISYVNRIAANRSHGTNGSEFMFVAGSYGGPLSECEIVNGGPQGAIFGYGCSAPGVYFGGHPLNNNPNIMMLRQGAPVVAKAHTYTDVNYQVAWEIDGETGQPSAEFWKSTNNSQFKEIIGNSYDQSGVTHQDHYSFVNDEVLNDQRAVSIAQVHVEGEDRSHTVYAWLSDHDTNPTLFLKEVSNLFAGASILEGLDLSQTCAVGCEGMLGARRSYFDGTTVFPVPVKVGGLLTVSEDLKGSDFKLISVHGKTIQSGKISLGAIKVPESITPGVYQLYIKTTVQKVFNAKIVVEYTAYRGKRFPLLFSLFYEKLINFTPPVPVVICCHSTNHNTRYLCFAACVDSYYVFSNHQCKFVSANPCGS